MSIQRINFEPVSDILPVQRRDFVLADPTLADPLNAVALVDGEWMAINSAYKCARAAAIGTPGALATVRSFPVFAERGRSDVQAIAGTKTVLLWLGDYEFAEGDQHLGIEVISINPPGVVLQRGRQRWQAPLHSRRPGLIRLTRRRERRKPR